MPEQTDRDELIDLMSRYANMPDANDWDELPRTVLCDELTADFSSLGVPAVTVSRDAWCAGGRQAFAGWAATHHAITNHRVTVEGDDAAIHAHVHVHHWAPPEVASGGANCWVVAGFYDNTAVRTPDGWRLQTIKLTKTHQENEGLLAATMAAQGT